MLKIGHRGAKGHVSENTLASFGRALELGCGAIELDVHLSSDGQLFVFHDEGLERLTAASGHFEDLTSDKIRQLRIETLHPIPTLSETLDFIGNQCLVNIELKTEKTVAPTIRLLSAYLEKGIPPSHFLVSSFMLPALKTFREQLPEIPLGVLCEVDFDLDLAFAQTIQAETFHPYFHLLNVERMSELRSLGMKVYPWTVNHPEDIATMKNLGVDGIITDFPDRL